MGKAGRPKTALLDRDRVDVATIKILETRGLEGFSVRVLADALSVNPAALYHHFSGKEDILRSAVSRLLRRVKIPPDDLDWKRFMIEAFVNYWRLLVRKPFLSQIILAGYQPANTSVTARNEKMMSAAGLPLSYQLDIRRAFLACATGYAAVMTQREGAAAADGDLKLDPEETLRATLTLLLEHCLKQAASRAHHS